jgi:transcriptional antiterminator NusG
MKMAARWYIVHAYSNFEKKVAESIEEKARQKGLSHLFEDVIVVPTEKVVEIRRGRKVDSRAQVLPGLCAGPREADRRGVSPDQEYAQGHGFLGSDNKPVPIPDFGSRAHPAAGSGWRRASEALVSFEVGEQVRVADGPFASFNGIVQDVDEERARLKVEVSIFGRATPVELEYGQVEKV